MQHFLTAQNSGPLAVYAHGFQQHLESLGYAPDSVRWRLRQLATLDRWLVGQGLRAAQIDRRCIEELVADRRAAGRTTFIAVANFDVLMLYLRSIGAVPEMSVATDARSRVLGQYRDYLSAERGLAQSSITTYLQVVNVFCRSLAGPLGELTYEIVRDYISRVCKDSSVGWSKKTVTALGSFLRYLYVSGVTTQPLAQVLPKLSTPGQQLGVSKALSEPDFQRLLAGCDTNTAVGLRDATILVVLWSLGLRRCEVAGLRVDDINWRTGEIIIHGKGNRHDTLPLPIDVGQALVDYFQHGQRRVPLGCRAVFVNVRAPEQAMTAVGISNVVTRAAHRVGLAPLGAHQLRHGTATHLVRHGASWPEIAQVLRHRTMAVTVGYTTVDPILTRELARPWPGVS